jgi:hypothetical protein
MRSDHNTFKRTFALAAVAALLLAAQPAESRARAARQQGVPFTISSFGTPFGVQVKLTGTYTVNETQVEVHVERALIYVSEHCPYQGRRFVNTLILGLATQTPRARWEIENRSLPVFVERVMSPREEYRLAGLTFQIPRNANTDLSKRWLVVEAEETALDVPDNDPDKTGYHFAHSRRDLFAAPDAAQTQP